MPDARFPRLAALPDYPLVALEARKGERRAAGHDVFEFGLGNPDRGAPEQAVERLVEAARDWRNHRYLAAPDQVALRGAIARWYRRRHGVEIDPATEAVGTIGAKEGIAHLVFAVVGPDEVVLAPDPCYPIHRWAIYFAGGRYQPVRTGPGLDPVAELERAYLASPRPPKLALVNFPHNPTTAIVDARGMEAIVRWAERRDLWLISDFAYADFGFEAQPPSALAVDGARARTVEFFSVSKSYNMPGFRCGFCVGNATLVGALKRMKSYQDYDLFAPIQLAAAHALDEGDDFPRAMRALYRDRAAALVAGLGEAGWPVPAPAATMFVWAPLPERFRAEGSMRFSERLLDEAGVAVSPGAGFGEQGEGFVRFALVEEAPRIAEACRAIGRMLTAAV